MPWLHYGGNRLHLRSAETVIGSGERADHRLEGFGLEPRHFVIALGAGGATIRIVHADNVVTVNGEQLRGDAAPISHGDVIGAGQLSFLFLEREDVAATARPIPVSPLLHAAEVWLIDDRARAAYPVSEERVGIGRDPSNTIPLRSSTVSRFHAHLRREAGGAGAAPRGILGDPPEWQQARCPDPPRGGRRDRDRRHGAPRRRRTAPGGGDAGSSRTRGGDRSPPADGRANDATHGGRDPLPAAIASGSAGADRAARDRAPAGDRARDGVAGVSGFSRLPMPSNFVCMSGRARPRAAGAGREVGRHSLRMPRRCAPA